MWIRPSPAFFELLVAAILLCTASCRDQPPECRRSSLGFDYIGHKNTTISGRTCQAWSSQTPHEHENTDPRRFPDDTLEDAGNYCRNPQPGAQLGGPWCYTMDPAVVWELCEEIPWCSEFPECRLTDAGTEYKGHISVTQTGASCIDWSSVPRSSGPHLAADDANYCRNPDNKPEGPWCYTDIDTWDFCDVPFCKPSAYCRRTAKGQEYVGTVSNTGPEVPCQRWDSQYPHAHPEYAASDFPDATVSDANNYCRNPDGRDSGPWCYTQDPDIEQESCDLAFCEDCKISDNGAEYAGSLSKTASGRSCLTWAYVTSSAAAPLKDSNRFPDASVADASNFCRNPDRKAGGPWCFWADDASSWEYCNIPKCSGSDRDTFKPRIAQHVLHIGIDGLAPCFANCSSGAPNIIQRVGAQGTSTLTRGRTVLQTVSAPSWTSILCGTPVETSGVTGNSWKSPWLGYAGVITPSIGNNVPSPCMWQEIKAQDRTIRTASFTNWDWFWYITSMGMPTALDFDYYCDNYKTCDPELVDRATDYLNQTFRSAETSYTFVYIGNVDEMGHTYGWCSEEFLAEVDRADEYVGQLLDVVDESGMADRITVMVSDDHGGHGRSHGAMLDSDIVVPVFIRGPGVRVGAEFRHEVTNNDYVPTAMESLGLRQSKWWKGDVMWEAMESN